MNSVIIGLNQGKTVLARVEAEAPVVVKEAVEGFAYSKCDPKKPEVYTPREDVVRMITEDDFEVAEIIGTGDLHEDIHLAATMAKLKAQAEKINDRMCEIARKFQTGSSEIRQLYNVLEDPRIERIGCEFLPGKEKDFTYLIRVMYEKKDGFKWQKARDCLAVTGQYLLIHSRLIYSKATCLAREADKGHKSMSHYFTEQEINQILKYADTAIMTGHFGDHKNFENAMAVLSEIEKILEMIKQGQERYDKEPEQGDGKQGDGKQGAGKQGNSQAEDDTVPGQTKGKKWEGTGKVINEIKCDLQEQIKETFGKEIRDCYNRALVKCIEAEQAKYYTDTQTPAEPSNGKARIENLTDIKRPKLNTDWIETYSAGAERLKKKLIEDGLRSTVYQTGRLDSKRLARTYTAARSGHRVNAYIAERKGQSEGHDISIVIDASGSMLDSKINGACRAETAIRAGYMIYKACREVPKVTCRITCYDSCTYEVARAGEHISLRQAAERYAGWGGTYTGMAVREATRELAKRRGKKKLEIIITDGEASDSRDFGVALEYAKKAGVRCVVIYVDTIKGIAATYPEAEGIEIAAEDLSDRLLTLVSRAI